jgi:hypothetical protein
MITKEKHPVRVLFFRDHEISGLGPAGADPLTVGVRGRAGLRGRASGAAPGDGERAQAGSSTIRPPDTAAALSLSRSAGRPKTSALQTLKCADPLTTSSEA